MTDRRSIRCRRPSVVCSLVALVMLVAPCMASETQVHSFEEEGSEAELGSYLTDLARSSEHATEGEWALRVRFRDTGGEKSPGFTVLPRPDWPEAHILTADVHNPGAEALRLSWRVDREYEGAAFSGKELPPGQTTGIKAYVGAAGALDGVFFYLRRNDEARELHFDNFVVENVSDRYVPLEYVDPHQPPEPTAEEAERGFIAFRRPVTDAVFAQSVPRPHERLSRSPLVAVTTPGEYEPVALSLHALRDLGEARIEVEGLPASAGIFVMRGLNKLERYAADRYIRDMPVLWERRDTADLQAGRSTRALFDLQVAEDAAPGVHEGRVIVRLADGRTHRFPLHLRVLPYRLEEPEGMWWGQYYGGPNGSGTIEGDLRDMRAHGMTSMGIMGWMFKVPVQDVEFGPDGECTFDWDGTSRYERLMQSLKVTGFEEPMIYMGDPGAGAANTHSGTQDESDPTWRSYYRGFYVALAAYHENQGWPELIVQPLDEPRGEARQTLLRRLKLLASIPQVRSEQDHYLIDEFFHEVAGPWADVWKYGGGVASRERTREARAAGKTIVIYNYDVESFRAELSRYANGWYQDLTGCSGAYNWAYQGFRNGSPYNDLDGGRTWVHVYPPMGELPGGPSVGYVGAREGVDDYCYLNTLRQAIARAGDDGSVREAVERAEELLTELAISVDYSPRVRGEATWSDRGRTPHGTSTISGTLLVPNGWAHEDYDNARWRIAQATMELMRATGEIADTGDGTARAREAAVAGAGPVVREVTWLERPEQADAGPGEPDRAHQASVPVWSGGPEIDGKLTDPQWEDAGTLGDFVHPGGQREPAQQTEVLLGSDGRTLYVGAICHEDNVQRIAAEVTEEDGAVWNDDCFEVFVDHNLDRTTYRQILVNSLGTQAWIDSANPQWRANSRAQAHVGDDRWTVEIAIPLNDLGLSGGMFGLNACRERRAEDEPELSCWAPTGGQFGKPGRFGIASFGQSWIQSVRTPPAVRGSNPVEVWLRNDEDRLRRLVVTVDTSAGERVASKRVRMAPGESAGVRIRWRLTGQQAPDLILRLRDADSRALLAERPLSMEVREPLEVRLHPRQMLDRRTVVVADVSLGDDLRDSTRVSLRLAPRESGGGAWSREIGPPRGERMECVLDVADVSPGAYRLTMQVTGADGAVLGEASRDVTVIRGPFE